MSDVSFRLTGTDMETGESLYRLTIDGIVVREKMTLDEVVREINTREIESEARGVYPSVTSARTGDSSPFRGAKGEAARGKRRRYGNV